MIVGIGTDIVTVSRMAENLERMGDRFARRLLTETEYKEYEKKHNGAAYLAKRFAAKEAVYKALSAAPVTGLGWHDAEILNTAGGAPVLTLFGSCKRALEEVTPEGYKASVNLSLSDEPPYAVAFVVISAGPLDRLGE